MSSNRFEIAKTSNIAQRWSSYVIPGVFFATSIACHVTTAIFHPVVLFSNLESYKEKAFASLWAIGGVICAHDTPGAVEKILAQSHGTILDIGPGAGHQLHRFSNPKEITAIYGVEPGVSMHSALKGRAEAAGLGAKYHILACGAAKEELIPALTDAGVYHVGKPAFDEIVCIRVLCGVDEPGAVIAGLYDLLKPGGRMVVCEHVVNSGDSKQYGTPVGRFLQQFYMTIGWKGMMGGCELNRDTFVLLNKAAEKDGGWSKIDIDLVDPFSTIPHVVGTLVKK